MLRVTKRMCTFLAGIWAPISWLHFQMTSSRHCPKVPSSLWSTTRSRAALRVLQQEDTSPAACRPVVTRWRMPQPVCVIPGFGEPDWHLLCASCEQALVDYWEHMVMAVTVNVTVFVPGMVNLTVTVTVTVILFTQEGVCICWSWMCQHG